MWFLLLCDFFFLVLFLSIFAFFGYWVEQLNQYWMSSVRFHPLTEFDEGKRSCRRRLAGHNRRRRKTLPEDTTSRLLLPGNQNTGNAELDIVNLLAVLTRTQGQFLNMLNESIV